MIRHQGVGRLSARQQRPIEGPGLLVIAAQVEACGQSWRRPSIMRVKQLDRRQCTSDSIGSQMAPRVDEKTEPGVERCPYRLLVQPIGEADGDQGSSRWRIGGSRFSQYAERPNRTLCVTVQYHQGARIGGAGASKYRQAASHDAPGGGLSPRAGPQSRNRSR